MTHTCAECSMRLLDPHPTDLVREAPKFDDIIICGACGAPNKITLLGTVVLTNKELEALSPDERREISFAVRAVKRHVRNS